MAMCIICGTQEEEEFRDSRDDFCDRCKDIMDYWFKEAFTDINTIVFAHAKKKLTIMDFADMVEAYGNVKWREEYERSKNRQKRR